MFSILFSASFSSFEIRSFYSTVFVRLCIFGLDLEMELALFYTSLNRTAGVAGFEMLDLSRHTSMVLNFLRAETSSDFYLVAFFLYWLNFVVRFTLLDG